MPSTPLRKAFWPAGSSGLPSALLLLLSVALTGAGELRAQSDSVQRLDGPTARWFVSDRTIDPQLTTQPEPLEQVPDWRPVKTPANLLDPDLNLGFTANDTIWYRHEFVAPAGWEKASLALRLGEINDRDRAYLNGTLIGQTGEWDAEQCQAYDKQRIYELPPGLLQAGTNTLLIQVQGCFPDELGIYRDRIELGPVREVLRAFYFENVSQSISLAVYLTFSAYFALFFLRRRQERENLYFALFLLAFVIYSVNRTQWKYELGFSLYELKRLQTISVILTLPLFLEFVRAYFQKYDGRYAVWRDRFFYGMHLANGVIVTIIALHPSNAVWQDLLFTYVQPGWAVYSIGVLVIVGRAAWRGDRDAWLMLGASLLLLIALVLDILAGQALINLPTVLTYAFTLFVIVMALILANRFVRLHDETERLNVDLTRFNQASRRFVPFEFLNLLQKQSLTEVSLGDQVQKEMTVLFSDIRSFTELSEKMTPKENFDFINSYLRRMGPIIRNHNGFIDKYIGDAIMALFPGSPADAVQAVVEMRSAIAEWNAGRLRHGFAAVQTGFGLHLGRLMLGTIGEQERMEGTVISDDVNLASRVESATKFYGAAALLTGPVAAAVPNNGIETRYLGKVVVKGKNAPITLYELLSGGADPGDVIKLKSRASFEAAVALYERRAFPEALEAFEALLQKSPEDLAARLFRERAADAVQTDRPPEWQGADRLAAK